VPIFQQNENNEGFHAERIVLALWGLAWFNVNPLAQSFTLPGQTSRARRRFSHQPSGRDDNVSLTGHTTTTFCIFS
jgi:hypothetical protein